jgi:hypothetical protein
VGGSVMRVSFFGGAEVSYEGMGLGVLRVYAVEI